MKLFNAEKVELTNKQKVAVGISLTVIFLELLLCIGFLIFILKSKNLSDFTVTFSYIFYAVIIVATMPCIFVITNTYKKAREKDLSDFLKELDIKEDVGNDVFEE